VLTRTTLRRGATVLLVISVAVGTGVACSGSGSDGPPTGYAPGQDGAADATPGADSGAADSRLNPETREDDSTVGDSPSTGNGDGSADAPLPRGPTPPANGTSFPFPQNRQGSNCNYPSRYLNSDVQAAYAKWKSDTVTSSGAPAGTMRVQRLSSDQGAAPYTTVSEGIGYGMLLAVYMGDQTLFDQVWMYEQQFLDANGLMNWNIDANGDSVSEGDPGYGAATDADEDMAFALVMASKQWGGQGSLSQSYAAIALTQIKAIWAHEIYDYLVILPGDGYGNTMGSSVNVSYFAPAYYRVFATLDPPGSSTGDAWMNALDQSYTTLAASLNTTNGNESNGLVPAWCTSAGVPNSTANGANTPTNYQYDSCRTPFRIGLDWCWNGETRAQSYVALTSSFFAGIGAKNIVDGYYLDGGADPQTNPNSTATQSAAFIGTAGVGAMSSSTYQSFVNDAYGEVATLRLLQGGTYYEDSWTTMSLLMMTANFLDYTNPAYTP
jgi:endo-1,4-beta-D-glucanase Y